MDFINILFDQTFSFMRNTVIVSLLSSVPAGVIGTFVVANRMTYIAGSISHSVLGGVGMAVYLNYALDDFRISPSVGGLLFSLISGTIISFIYVWGKERIDTAISAVWLIGMSIGIIFSRLTPKFTDLTGYLFGNILLISRADVLYTALLTALVVGTVFVFFHQFVLVSFDRDFSITRGVNPKFFITLLILLISVTVFLLIKTVGAILSIALVTLPSAMSSMFVKRFLAVMLSAVLLTAVSQLSGIYLSYELDLPTGITITLLLCTLYIASLFLKGILGERIGG